MCGTMELFSSNLLIASFDHQRMESIGSYEKLNGPTVLEIVDASSHVMYKDKPSL